MLFVKKSNLLVFATQNLDSMPNEEWDFEHQHVCDFS